ncbi:MAG: Maf family protein [Myxococcota bacterium]
MSSAAPLLVLASGSAVRRRLLTRAGLVFRVDVADIEEGARPSEAPFDLARRLAREKAEAVAARWPSAVVVGADQVGVVDSDGPVLRKCYEEEQAVEQLLAMAGREHTFCSAAAVMTGTVLVAEVEQRATVRFRAFGKDEARAYVALGEWLGSAGSYHLEGRGVRLIESVTGPETAVLGLPLLPLLGALRDLAATPDA